MATHRMSGHIGSAVASCVRGTEFDSWARHNELWCAFALYPLKGWGYGQSIASTVFDAIVTSTRSSLFSYFSSITASS